VHASLDLKPAAQLRLLERCDALRRPGRFADLLLACECDARGRLGLQQRDYPQRARLLQALAFARSVDTAAVAQRFAALGQAGPQIGEAIHAARVEALHQGFAPRA
jgi:tRNA nucleotidyltransferase (CCA-adding enzyme)